MKSRTREPHNKNNAKKPERVVVYYPKRRYLILRSRLIAAGKTVSGWFREQADKIVNEKK